MRKLFELDAAVSDAELGITALWKGLEVTTIDGTTMELARSDVLEDEFGTPADGARPLRTPSYSLGRPDTQVAMQPVWLVLSCEAAGHDDGHRPVDHRRR